MLQDSFKTNFNKEFCRVFTKLQDSFTAFNTKTNLFNIIGKVREYNRFLIGGGK